MPRKQREIKLLVILCIAQLITQQALFGESVSSQLLKNVKKLIYYYNKIVEL